MWKAVFWISPDYGTCETKSDTQTPPRPHTQNLCILGREVLTASFLAEEILAACRCCDMKNDLDIKQKKNDIIINT